jgi:hypothetical protein
MPTRNTPTTTAGTPTAAKKTGGAKTARVAPVPATSSSSKTNAVRTVAPMIPLAIALLHSAVPASGNVGGTLGVGPAAVGPTATIAAVKCGDGVEDFHACHAAYPTGCTISGSVYDPYLNLLKNQTTWAATQPEEVFTSLQQIQDLEAKLPAGLNPKNHGDNFDALAALGEGKIHGIVGYLNDIKVEGKESSNCQLDDDTDHENVDFHIFIGFDPAIAEKIRNHTTLTPAEHKIVTQQSAIVEMTPHYRYEFHPEWTAEAVQAAKGQQVKVLGQLMVDNEHYVAGQDCGRDPSKTACWRATVWELHPVTDFEVCEAGNCTATSAGWSPLKESGSESAAAAPKGTASK